MRIKTKVPQTTQRSYGKDSFELILNDHFFNILNVKEETESWPQSFYDINAFFIKVFFLPILSHYMLNYQCNYGLHFFLNNILNLYWLYVYY